MQKKWKEKRVAAGKFKPLLFAMLEITAIIICIFFLSSFNMLILSALSYIGAMFYIITVVIPRYKKIVKRQKLYQFQN